MTLNNKQIKNLKKEDLAYWIGVVQSDGYFKKQFVKRLKVKRYYIVLGVGEKSLPMQYKFIKISQKIFKVKGSMFISLTYNKFKKYEYKFGCKNLLKTFNLLDIKFSEPVTPPKWVLNKHSLFGAYLAGVIDADGDIRITRPKYPQCQIRISTKEKPIELIIGMKKHMTCAVNNRFGDRTYIGRYFVTEFKVSKKNYNFINNYLINHLALEYKKNKINNFLRKKEGRWPGLSFLRN